MADPFTVACVQLTAERDIEPNLPVLADLVRRARDDGADLICLPENLSMMEPRNKLVVEKARPEDEHEALALLKDLARETGAWILAGSLAIRVRDEGRLVANRSFLIDAGGDVTATYDKIHMFDVDLPGGESYRESATFRPGDKAVLAHTPWGEIGLSICYDLRFAHLYRLLAKAGAKYLAVPAAFTRQTGRAHWHTLLRARAIETGCFVFAPAQCGDHAEGRQTFGHALIVDPWGEVLADGGEDPGYVTARIDPARVDECRAMVPALHHDRAFQTP